MFKKFVNWYFNFLKKWYLPVLIIFILITGVLGFFGTKIDMRSDFIDLLSKKNKLINNMRGVFRKFGGQGYLICTLEYKHDFYDLSDKFQRTEKTYSALFRELDKWDPYDAASTQKYLTKAVLFIPKLIRDQNKFINELTQHKVNLRTEKSKKYYAKFLDLVNTSNNKLKVIWKVFSNKPKNGKSFLKALLKHLNTQDKDKAFKDFKKSIKDSQILFDQIKKSIKSNFVKPETIKNAANKIVNTINSKKLKDIRFIVYRKPIKWMKDSFFYLVDYRDLLSLHKELKKIHLSAVRVLGSDKFQGLRDILNKYPTNLGDSNDEDENSQAVPVNNTTTGARGRTTSPAASTQPNDEKIYQYTFNDTKDMLLILIKPSGRSSDLKYSKIFLNKIKGIVKNCNLSAIDPRIEYGFTGRYVKKVEDADVLNRDIKITSLIALLLIMLFIFIYFRRVRAIFATIIPLFSGLMWALGIIYFLVGYFNIITGFIVAILSGLGIDFGIHLLARYYEERKEGKDTVDALKVVFTTTLKATITAATTTAFAFLCLVVTEFEGFSQFGYTIFIGLLLIVFSMFISFPCILMLSEKIRPIKMSRLKKGKEETLSKLKGKKFPYPVAVVAIGILVTIVSLMFKPQFDFDFSKLRAASSKSIKLDNKISVAFDISLWPSIIYVKDMKTSREITNVLYRRSQYAKELMKKLEAFHKMNFMRGVYRNSKKFKQKNLARDGLNYLNLIKNEVTLDLLINYFKKIDKTNFEQKKKYINRFIKSAKNKIYLNYVKQYLNNIAAEIQPTSAGSDTNSSQSQSTREENAEDSIEGLDLSVPETQQEAGRLSAKDKNNLKLFFNSLLNANIPNIDKIIKKPFDYKKILSNVSKIVQLASHPNATKAVKNFFFKIKSLIQIESKLFKNMIKINEETLTSNNILKAKSHILKLLDDGYGSYEKYKSTGLPRGFEAYTDNMIKEKQIILINEPQGDLYQAMARPFNLKRIVERLRVMFDYIDSIVRYLPNDQAKRKIIIRKIAKILNDNKFVKKIKTKKDKNLIKEAKNSARNMTGVSYSTLPYEIVTRFSHRTNDKGKFIFVYPNTGFSISENVSIMAYARYLASIQATNNSPVYYASETVIFADILRIINKDGLLILVLTMIAIIGLLLLDFKSLKALLFTNIPLIGGAIWMFLFMRVFGVKINYLNAAIFPVILGVGIDEGVHIYHRYLEEGKKNLWFIIRTTGVAVFMADFTTAIGFTALMFANFRGLRTMGYLAVIGIMTAFIVAVTILPALLQLLDNYKEKKELKKKKQSEQSA